MITMDDVVSFLHTTLAYEQRMVSIINTKGEQIPLSSFSELYSHSPSTVKIEGFERYSRDVWNICIRYANEYKHNGPVTCHIFLSQEDAPSFPVHTDPDDVIIHCIDGTKCMEVNGVYVEVEANTSLLIRANTPHRALNNKPALMMSIGLEKFLIEKIQHNELDNILKND